MLNRFGSVNSPLKHNKISLGEIWRFFFSFSLPLVGHNMVTMPMFYCKRFAKVRLNCFQALIPLLVAHVERVGSNECRSHQ